MTFGWPDDNGSDEITCDLFAILLRECKNMFKLNCNLDKRRKEQLI